MVVDREERGGTITEERSAIMMMVVVPTHIFQQETNRIYGYCFPSLIRNFNKLTSKVCKGLLGDCYRDVNEVDEN